MWPELLEQGFICSMVTPIIKIKKGKSEKVFYTLQDYDKWKSKNLKGWKIIDQYNNNINFSLKIVAKNDVFKRETFKIPEMN